MGPCVSADGVPAILSPAWGLPWPSAPAARRAPSVWSARPRSSCVRSSRLAARVRPLAVGAGVVEKVQGLPGITATEDANAQKKPGKRFFGRRARSRPSARSGACSRVIGRPPGRRGPVGPRVAAAMPPWGVPVPENGPKTLRVRNGSRKAPNARPGRFCVAWGYPPPRPHGTPAGIAPISPRHGKGARPKSTAPPRPGPSLPSPACGTAARGSPPSPRCAGRMPRARPHWLLHTTREGET